MVLIPKDMHMEEKCIKAKQAELEKLKIFETYDEVENTGQFCISTTWVLCDKGKEIRARLVARGYEDNQIFQKDSPTISKSALKTVMAITASKEWNIKTTDIKSAFLQGKEMERIVYLKPPKEANVKEGIIWKLKRCLYGLNDAARQFYQSVVDCLKNVGCKQSQLDPALFYMIDNGELIGIVASHVDDFLHSGTQVFEEKVMSKLRKRFVAGKIEENIFRYVGFDIIQDKRGIIMDQSKYISNMEGGKIDPNRSMNKEDQLTSDEQTLLRQIVGILNWAVQGSRPDMSFDMIEFSTKLKNGTVGDLIRAIKCIRKLQTGSSVVRFQNLGQFENWKLAVYTVAAHANLDGIGSIGAHIIFLMNPTGCVCPLSWVANKIKRVVRSTLSAEMLSLQEGLEDAIYLRKMITEIFNKQPESLPIKIYVDNKSVTQAIYSTKLVDDKRLRLDIASVKESMENNELSGIKWIPSEDQLANCMTKRGTNGYKLMQVLFNGRISI